MQRLVGIGLFITLLLCAFAAQASTLLVIGDSLSSAYGIAPAQGWVSLLQQRLQDAGYPHKVVNASITGDTTRGGLARLSKALRVHQPSVVIIELGGNDGLRGLSLSHTRANLSRMVDLSLEQSSRVLLLGMRLPPNYGKTFTERFHRIYADIAAEKGVALVPFFLEGVAEKPELMQADEIHPNAAGNRRMLENVFPALKPLLGASNPTSQY